MNKEDENISRAVQYAVLEAPFWTDEFTCDGASLLADGIERQLGAHIEPGTFKAQVGETETD